MPTVRMKDHGSGDSHSKLSTHFPQVEVNSILINSNYASIFSFWGFIPPDELNKAKKSLVGAGSNLVQ